MATNDNEQSAKPMDTLNAVSGRLDKILDTLQVPANVPALLNVARTAFGKSDFKIRPILAEMINNVDRPLLKQMAQDVFTVLTNWFEDPQTLCCLIQGLFAMFQASTDASLDNTDFALWIDIIVAFLDIVIVLLTSNIKKLSLAIPDFIKEIMNGVMGAILLVLQEVLFVIRDSLINKLLEEFDKNLKADEPWAKCLPLAQLLEILRKYISDFGLFAELFEKIKGFIGNMVGNFGYMKALDFPKNIEDLEFLYWLRELLLKLKIASMSFDLCFVPQTAAVGGAEETKITGALGINKSKTAFAKENPSTIPDPNIAQGIIIAPDGTILEDKATLKKNTLSVLTNSSIRGFLNKYYGYPLEVVNSLVIGSTSLDSIQGTNNGGNLNLNADCPNAPAPADIVKWALRVRNRNI